DNDPRLCADRAADRAARDDGDGDRPPRRALPLRQGGADGEPPPRVAELGARSGVRPRARPWFARADVDGATAANPERDDLRLRVGVAPAPARLPRCDTRRRARMDPTRPTCTLRRRAAETPPVRWPEGGVLPRRLRARPGRARHVAERSCADARRPPAAARRLALPPALESTLPADAATSRQARLGRRGRPAAHRGAAGLRPLARAAVGDRARAGGRRAEPDRAR